jgi:hypothetical protein
MKTRPEWSKNHAQHLDAAGRLIIQNSAHLL